MNMPFFAGTGFLIFSIYLLHHALKNYEKSLNSQIWPSTEGQLIEVLLWGSRNVAGQMKEVEHLKVVYEYEVQGKRFVGDTVAFYALTYPETAEFENNHTERTDIKVYYNPAKFDEVVLIPGPKKGNKRYSEIILSSIGITASIAVMVSSWFGVLG